MNPSFILGWCRKTSCSNRCSFSLPDRIADRIAGGLAVQNRRDNVARRPLFRAVRGAATGGVRGNQLGTEDIRHREPAIFRQKQSAKGTEPAQPRGFCQWSAQGLSSAWPVRLFCLAGACWQQVGTHTCDEIRYRALVYQQLVFPGIAGLRHI